LLAAEITQITRDIDDELLAHILRNHHVATPPMGEENAFSNYFEAALLERIFRWSGELEPSGKMGSRRAMDVVGKAVPKSSAPV